MIREINIDENSLNDLYGDVGVTIYLEKGKVYVYINNVRSGQLKYKNDLIFYEKL